MTDQNAPDTTPAPSKGPWPRRLLRRAFLSLVGMLALGMAAQLLFVFTPLTEALHRRLIVTQPPAKADLVVCLGGSYDRLFWTAQLMRDGYAPLAAVSNAPGAAPYMRQLLVMCGVPRKSILVDTTSHTTRDHPVGIAGLPGVDRSKRLVIVTDHEHSRRAAACFRKAGFRNFTIYGGPFPPSSYTADSTLRQRMKWRIMITPRLLYEYSGLTLYWFQGCI